MMRLAAFTSAVVLCATAVCAASVGEQSLPHANLQAVAPEQRRTGRWRRKMGDLASPEIIVRSNSVISTDESIPSPGLADDTKEELRSALPSVEHSTKFIAECAMPSKFGTFRLRSYSYRSPSKSLDPIVIFSGDVRGKENVLVRVHDQCFTSEVFGSLRCDCREQLQQSLREISEHGGVLIYLQQEGRGIGLPSKIAAYSLQDLGYDTVDANEHLGFNGEMREYHAVPDILNDLDVRSIRLITNNPFKMDQIRSLGVNIVDRVSMEVPPNPYNLKYLISKRDKMDHLLDPNMKVDADVPEVAAAGYPSVSVEETRPVMLPNPGYAFGRESVVQAIHAIAEGKVVVVVDDEDRENEGDLIMAAELATPESVGFIVRHSSGVLCVSLEEKRLLELRLPPMVVNNEDPKQTAYTVSADYRHGTSTGISAADRAATFRALVDPSASVSDFQRPGHVFPLRYRPGGVLVRAGHTEASLDLTRLAGLRAGGVLAEIVNDDGSMARLPTLREFSREHGLVLTSVQDITAYRYELESNKTEVR